MTMSVILDSGAYTAWRSGKQIDLQAYIRFCHDNADWVTHAACLDMINPGDPEQGAADGMVNYKTMRAAGLRPIPIYHVGENIRWLQEMLDLGADYIGLSASSIGARGGVDQWYDAIWGHLVSARGLPLVRCHAFGEGRLPPLLRNPWYSADTASWLYGSQRNAIVKVGRTRMSHRSDGQDTNAGIRDLGSMDTVNLAHWHDILGGLDISPAAFTRDKVGAIARGYIEAKGFMQMQAAVRAAAPIRHRCGSLFNQPLTSADPVHIPDFRLYLVMSENPLARLICAMVPEVTSVLISYAYVRSNRIVEKYGLREFCATPAKSLENNKKVSQLYSLIRQHITMESQHA